ncbi:TPA: universal stress protein UspC [Serratia fonticola]|jgi:universal stress protein C|uniref:universal stress protein UspC n=1 Tax=Serratia fonticola TaxID=47917 RepID=UPI000428617D|nr:universal stress protein UspC [Serratia fonticola]AKG71956.1 universal stress protein UspC [Serratia fonticola]MBL5860571.1 universal stress protein UspC [Serratia fonticola]MBL5906455.1 universal stress protein UspC [Serratia fonticola]MDK2374623.1 universal stress protein UspC [Serratia fonticola]CAI0814121.1 Universal stress protein A [Serratia fonticola]
MGYHNVLVTVAVAADSHRLVEKAVSIVRPCDGKITLVSIIANAEIFPAPMLGDLRALMEEETLLFMEELCLRANYPNIATRIIHGELGDCLAYANQKQPFDLVICGNHSDSMMNKVACSAARFINTSSIDVLIVPL